MVTYVALGADLALTRYLGTAGSQPLEVADSWGSVDLAVRPGSRAAARQAVAPTDLGRVEGRENLGQALVMRLLTPLGSLATLGHPEYGSRLGELTGRLNDETARNLARLYAIQSLDQEPRVAEVLDLAVTASADLPNVLTIGLSVRPIDDDDPLALALELTL
jgi:phage baseplate assembly protein W